MRSRSGSAAGEKEKKLRKKKRKRRGEPRSLASASFIAGLREPDQSLRWTARRLLEAERKSDVQDRGKSCIALLRNNSLQIQLDDEYDDSYWSGEIFPSQWQERVFFANTASSTG
jgi:hypothetical protein